MNLRLVTAGRDFCLYPIVIPSRKNQHTSFGAGMLDGRTHERADQLLQDNLTRQRFGALHHGRQIEALDGCLYRGVGLRDRLVRPEVRIQLLELSNLAFSAPTDVAVPRISQVSRRNLLEAACRVKASGALVGDRLI